MRLVNQSGCWNHRIKLHVLSLMTVYMLPSMFTISLPQMLYGMLRRLWALTFVLSWNCVLFPIPPITLFGLSCRDNHYKNSYFPIKNCDFPMKNGDFPMKNGDFPMKNGGSFYFATFKTPLVTTEQAVVLRNEALPPKDRARHLLGENHRKSIGKWWFIGIYIDIYHLVDNGE